jgi:hypothetical protein
MSLPKRIIEINNWLKFFFFHVKMNLNFYLFLASFISLTLLILRSVILPSNFFIQTLYFLNTSYIFLFLPSYPLFFLIYRKMRFNLMEKVGLSSIVNVSFYSIIGYLGNVFGFKLDAFFFFNSVVAFYCILLIMYAILKAKRRESLQFTTFTRLKTIRKQVKSSNSSDWVKKRLNLNGVLLMIFICLVIALYLVNIDVIGGTDPWYHIGIMKMITYSNSLPLNEYFGAMGFEIIGVIFYYFSGIDFIMIPNWFIIFSIPLTTLVIYNIMKRIFSNQSLVIFGIFLLYISSIGFQNIIFQFWPTMMVFTQGLAIFFLLYIRLKQYIKEERPTWNLIRKNLVFNYVIISTIFIAMYLSHSLLSLVFLISYTWIYVIYLAKDLKRGFDFVLMVLLFAIFITLFAFNISAGHLRPITLFFALPWYYVLFGGIGLVIFGGLIITYLRKMIDFKKGNFMLVILGKKWKSFTFIEKIIIPAVLLLTVVLSIGFFIANIFIFNFDLITVLSTFNIIIVVIFSFWGLLIFQSKPKGKPILLWLLSFGILVLVGFAFDVIRGDLSFFSRIFYAASPIIAIGFASYLYKLIKTGKIRSLQVKIFLILLVSFSSIISYIELFNTLELFSVNRNELSAVNWYVDYSENKSVLILEFGWPSIFAYYDYPFYKKNNSIEFISTQFYLGYNNTLIYPENQIDANGTNVLQAIKEKYHVDVFILLTDYFISVGQMNVFGRLTQDQINQYYTLNYLDRVFSTKTETGDCHAFYWVV